MYLYVLVCKVLYLWVHAIKASLWKLEGVASGTHYTPEQLRLPLNTDKGCQGTIHNMRMQKQGQNITMDQYMLVHTRIY